MRDSWRPVAGLADLPPGSRKPVRIDGHSLLLFNVDGGLHAIADSCPHAGAWLGGGKLNGCFLRCPAHGLEFDLRTGMCTHTRHLRLSMLEATIDGDAVFVRFAPHASLAP